MGGYKGVDAIPSQGGQANKFLFTDGGNMQWKDPKEVIALGDLSNVTETSPSAGQLLRNNGTAWVNFTAPAFSAYRDTSAQSITTSTATKVQFQTEEKDNTNAYDNATNFRFQPTVAGTYQVNACLSFGGTNITRAFTSIRKNGNEVRRGLDISISATSNSVSSPASATVDLNGSTDYIEIYGYCTATSPTIGAGPNASYFQAYLATGA